MLSFPSKNEKKKKNFPTGRVYLKKQTRVTDTNILLSNQAK